jgi:23S rRNA (adenine2503-C2)-methyltransferase
MTMSPAESGPARPLVFDFTREELEATLGEPRFRATQLFDALYRQGITDPDSITNLPRSLRASLPTRFDLNLPRVSATFTAEDGTRRHLVRLPDGELTETVFVPEGDRNTFCVSSQVGCALACRFCLTGQLGFIRHLSAGEIVAQALLARAIDIPDPKMRDHFNIVLMGMGEPLHNYDNVMKALRILNDPRGLGMSMSRITLSTVGLIPGIERLGNEELIPNLAVSLTGATDRVRDRLMPVNQVCPIRDLVACLRRFPRSPRRHLTLEYVLMAGITDTDAEARALARIAGSIPAKVNLIPLNGSPDLPFRRPERSVVLAFQKTLRDRGVTAFIRKSRGDDISAACGQLRKTWAEIDLRALGLAPAQ